MTIARDTIKKGPLKGIGWSEFAHRKSAATGTSSCICEHMIEDTELS